MGITTIARQHGNQWIFVSCECTSFLQMDKCCFDAPESSKLKQPLKRNKSPLFTLSNARFHIYGMCVRQMTSNRTAKKTRKRFTQACKHRIVCSVIKSSQTCTQSYVRSYARTAFCFPNKCLCASVKQRKKKLPTTPNMYLFALCVWMFCARVCVCAPSALYS